MVGSLSCGFNTFPIIIFFFGSDRRGDLLWRSTDNIVMTIFDKGDREYIIDFSDG